MLHKQSIYVTEGTIGKKNIRKKIKIKKIIEEVEEREHSKILTQKKILLGIYLLRTLA